MQDGPPTGVDFKRASRLHLESTPARGGNYRRRPKLVINALYRSGSFSFR
jgi:hypothetical protein